MLPELPRALEPFREQLSRTLQPYIRITSTTEAPATPLQSKVGGEPYLPAGAEWPRTPEGQALFFLAQLNFAEMPRLEPFPEKGIVQFFILDDDLYGMDFDEPERQHTFRVLFLPDPKPGKQAPMPAPADYEELPHHPEASYALRFEKAEAIASASDYRFARTMGADFFARFGDKEWELLDAYNKAVNAQGHKVGGYAYFTQDDPRSHKDPMLLLFQLDSDEKMDLMWGDMGVGHFFIREADLRAGNFSRVLYDWDCL